MKEWKNQKARTAELLDSASGHNRGGEIVIVAQKVL